MAREFPNRYDDPFWVNLAANTEQKLGLPDGLLVSVLTQGEKTNADRVSSAGARTPFQIIPETRQGAIKQYGIDPYLNPENAAEVAGRLLKDSLSRNAGDIEQAIGEYHGGLDRKQWGKINEAYRQRVLAGIGQAAQPQHSTFQRVQQRRAESKPQSESISQVYDAYQSGRMTPEDAATFEQAVSSGAIMLPRGAQLKGGRAQVPAAGAAPEPQLAPQALTEAYVNGTMDPRDREQLEGFMRAGLVKLPPTQTSQIPGEGGYVPPTEQGIITPPPEPTLTDRLMQAGQQIAGAAETALALGTGAVGGTVGTITGTAGQMAREIAGGTFGTREAADRITQAGMQAAGNLTYAPRSEAEQAQTQAAARALQSTIPIGMLPGQLAALGRAATIARPSVQAATTIAAGQAQRAGQATAAGAQRAAQVVRTAPARAMEAVGLREPAAAPAAAGGARQSGGAAATAAELQRYEQSQNLPVPVPLTVGEATRSADVLAFEKEQIRGPAGQPLRTQKEAQNLALMQNMDALFDMTDAQSASAVEAGGKVQKSLMEGYQAAKNKVRAAYKNAEKAGELETSVTLQPVLAYINGNISEADLAPILSAARKKALAIGAAVEGPDGQLVAQPTTLAKAEGLRQTFQRAGYEGADMFHGRQLRDAFDAATDGLGGDLYKQARALRRQQAIKFENRAVVSRLVSSVKGGDDPRTYAGQVFQRSILNAQPEEITFLRRVLLTSGKDGRQAWKELQGSLVRHIQEQATKGVGMDSQGRPMASTGQLHRAVTEMDKNGRLDLVLGKQQASIVRDLSEVARYISTVPPGTQINNSGTSMALMMAIAEAGAGGALTGLPVPVLSVLKLMRDQVKSAELRAKIQRTLTYKPPQ